MYGTCLLKLAVKLRAKVSSCKTRKPETMEKSWISILSVEQAITFCLVAARCKLKLVCLVYMFYRYSCLGASCKCTFHVRSISVHYVMLTSADYDLVNHSDLT